MHGDTAAGLSHVPLDGGEWARVLWTGGGEGGPDVAETAVALPAEMVWPVLSLYFLGKFDGNGAAQGPGTYLESKAS